MDTVLNSLIDLPKTAVSFCQKTEGIVCLHLQLSNQLADCYFCQRPTKELHQTTFVLIRDLPIFGKPVYLKVPRRRFYCRHCQKYFT